MKKLIISLVAVLVAILALLGVKVPAEASPTAYTRLIHIVQGPNYWIPVVCHDKTTGTIKLLAYGDDSFFKCPTGWVDGVRMDYCLVLRVRNWNTGNVTVYPRGYQGNIGGGNYDAWVTYVC